MRRFENKVVLITGAASGIGKATAERIAEEGGKVACVDISEEAVNGVAEKLGGDATALVCDVSQEDQVKATVAKVVEHYGELNVLCNVAGILRADHSHELSLEAWNKIITVNLTGAFLFCREALPHLVGKYGNNIVNCSSTAAIGSHPWMAAYAASKGGLLSMTRTLSVEYAKQKIRVNAVVPGGINTPLHGQFGMPEGADPDLLRGAIPFVKYCGPEHVASVIAMLASDDGRYINGTEIRIDGGALA